MKEMSDILTSWIKSLTFSIATIIERIHISTNRSLTEERVQSFDIFIAGIIEGYRLYFMHANFTDVKTVLFSYFLFQILSFNQNCFVCNCQLLQIDIFIQRFSVCNVSSSSKMLTFMQSSFCI